MVIESWTAAGGSKNYSKPSKNLRNLLSRQKLPGGYTPPDNRGKVKKKKYREKNGGF
jgi:hypothetical protein